MRAWNAKVLLAVAVAGLSGRLYAQFDPALEALLDARQDEAAQRLIAERLARDPADPVALCYDARIPLIRGDTARFDEAIARLERCVALKPDTSDYHLWLGRAYGLKAQHAGVLRALGLVRGVRTEFLKALELDPRNHDARHDLLQFYMRAPRIAGGGMAKARTLATDCLPVDPDMARVLQALIAIEEKAMETAWTQAAAIGTPADTRVAGYARRLFRDLAAAARREGLPELAAKVDAEARRRAAPAATDPP